MTSCCSVRKAYDLDDAVAAIAPAMGEQSVVLPLLNGMRHLDVLKEKFGASRVLGGLTAINAALLADGSIQQSALRLNLNAIGELDWAEIRSLRGHQAGAGQGRHPDRAVGQHHRRNVAQVRRLCLHRGDRFADAITGRQYRPRCSRVVFRCRGHRRMLTHLGGRRLFGAAAECRDDQGNVLPTGLHLRPLAADRHGGWPRD